MKETRKLLSKRGWLAALMLLTAVSMNAKDDLFTVVEGSLDVLLEQKKTAVFEIDYSQLMVTNSKDHDEDVDFATWMQAQDEDDDKWTTDWESKDKEKCHKAFREHYNDEMKQGPKLTNLEKTTRLFSGLQ